MAINDNAPFIAEIKRLQRIEDAVREYLKHHPVPLQPYDEDMSPSEREMLAALKVKTDIRRD